MKWIIGMICPILFSVVAALLLIFKPKPNLWAGYRTSRTLSDERIWYYANKVMSVSMISINLAVCVPAICLINIFVNNLLAIILIDTFMPILGLIAVIIITEYCIRRKFGRNTY